MREHVLAMLKESDDFVSGQELCGKLSVSRTASGRLHSPTRGWRGFSPSPA